MRRSALLTALMLALIAVGFAIYWRVQMHSTMPGYSSAINPSHIESNAPSELIQQGIGPGTGTWANTFDDRGRLSSQFKAATFTPQKDGTFNVVRPVNVFYLNDGQYVVVTGDTGVVYVDAAAGQSSGPVGMSAGMQAPNRGLLHNVHIAMFPSRNAQQPTLWMDVNNLSFDNDTLRLYTQSYVDANGTTVAADQVPVTVRGDDYEFDGKGLTLRWNGRDHRLNLLEIAHGDRLEIKNPAKMSMPMGGVAGVRNEEEHCDGGRQGEGETRRGGDGRSTVSLSPPLLVSPPSPFSILHSPSSPAYPALASTDNTDAVNLLATTAPATQPAQVTYRAIFFDAVRIFQGDRQMAIADKMTVDFLPSQENKTQNSATKPAATLQPVAPIIEAQPAAPPAAEKIAEQGVPSPASQPAVPQPTGTIAVATTQKSNPPVTVRWTGKLRVTPLDTDPVMPVTEGQAAVQLDGSPVVLTPQGSTVRAATVIYRNGDGAAQLKNSAAQPIVDLQTDRGMKFTAASVNYDPSKSTAIISGNSHLSLPLEKPGQTMTATWTKTGKLHFVGKTAQSDTVDRVDLSGDVVVDHPQFNLQSDNLALFLAKSTKPTNARADGKSGVELTRAVANGSAKCRMMAPGQPDQGINSDRLEMVMALAPDGRRAPHQVFAEGNVNAFDANQTLTAEHLQALLHPKPATANAKPAADSTDTVPVELESMDASAHVHSVLKNGAIADADQLNVITVDGKPKVKLTGTPDAPARLQDGKGGDLKGTVIHITPDQRILVVDGGGTMHSIRQTNPKEPAKPVDVAWTDSLNIDGAANTVDAVGKVTVRTTDLDGTVNTIVGDKAHLNLMDTKPAKDSPATKPATVDAMGGKALKDLTLLRNVHGESSLLSPDGTVLKLDTLRDCSELTYDAVKVRTEIPGPGQLLMEDHRPPRSGSSDDSSARGSQVMTWDKSLVYDKSQHNIVVQGDVVIGIQQDQKDAQPSRLACQTMTVNLVDTDTPATTAGTDPKMKISNIVAEGGVDFRSKGAHLTADHMTYDPTTSLLMLYASPEQSGQIMDDTKTIGSFDTLEYDTKAQEIRQMTGAGGAVRK
jgi:hypothetical protein